VKTMIDESNRQSISLVSSGTPRRNKDHTNWTDTEELMESTPIDMASGHLDRQPPEEFDTWVRDTRRGNQRPILGLLIMTHQALCSASLGFVNWRLKVLSLSPYNFGNISFLKDKHRHERAGEDLRLEESRHVQPELKSRCTA